MKRIMKTCGALVLAASLMLGITGGYTPSLAADTTMTLEEFGSLYATVKTARLPSPQQLSVRPSQFSYISFRHCKEFRSLSS